MWGGQTCLSSLVRVGQSFMISVRGRGVLNRKNIDVGLLVAFIKI